MQPKRDPSDHGSTPVYVKRSEDMPWPTDKMFFLVTASGLFRCRNHEFFTSCIPSPGFPVDLAPQQAFLRLALSPIPRRVFELVVGFFNRIHDLYRSEAIVLLAWNRAAEQYEIIIPEQVAVVARSRHGDLWPVSVRYEAPPSTPDRPIVVSIHCHGPHGAYASSTDVWDETYRTGLHIVVGRIELEPPDIHAQAVVDGMRFNVHENLILEGYNRRRPNVPREWIDQVLVRDEGSDGIVGTGAYKAPSDHRCQDHGGDVARHVAKPHRGNARRKTDRGHA